MQYEVGEIEATNYPHEKMLAKNATLAAENARLREGLFELADGTAGVRRLLEEFWKTSNWWFAFYPTVERIVPAHIVALQEATYREGGE